MRKSILSSLKLALALALGSFSSEILLFDQAAHAASCRGGSGLGVHRSITLNTAGGKRYGKSHGGAQDFLNHKEVVLTFDDGPVSSTTNKVLHELDQHCAKATFFMVASMAKNNPSLARKVANKGHTVGIHSYSHKNLGQLSGSSAISDVNRSITAIEKAVGRDVAPFFRFPYLAENRSVNQHLKGLGYGVFAIDVDSLDYKFSKPTSMVNRVMSELNRKGKGIILLHDIQKVTANGIGQLLTRLKQDGYKLVHIRGRGGKDPKAPILVSSSSQPQKSNPVILASHETSKSSSQRKARKSIDAPKRQKTKKASVAKRLKNKSNPIRKTVKKRIVIAQAKPIKKSSSKKSASRKTKRLSPQEVFKQNQVRALKQFKKNKNVFRAAIKKRIIN